MPSADSNIYEYISHYMCGVFSFGLLIQLLKDMYTWLCMYICHTADLFCRPILIDIIHVTADLF